MSTVLKYLDADGVTWKPFTGDVPAPTASIVIKEPLTGLDGVKTLFTTGQPYVAGTLQVNLNSGLQGWAVTETDPATGKFTLDTAPVTTDVIELYYHVANTGLGNADTVDNYHANGVAQPNTLLPLNSSGKYPASVMPASLSVDWATPSLASGWGAWDSPIVPFPTTGTGKYGYPRYMKDALGFVHLDGLAKNTSGAAKNASTGALIFTLPALFRPSHALRIVAVGNNGTSDVTQEINIDVDGTIILVGMASIGNNQWISLNNIHFLAEQ